MCKDFKTQEHTTVWWIKPLPSKQQSGVRLNGTLTYICYTQNLKATLDNSVCQIKNQILFKFL